MVCRSDPKRCRRRHPAAFTIIELLVVVAIIALLIALLLPATVRAREVACIAVCASDEHQLSAAVVGYAADFRGSLPPVYSGDSRGTNPSDLQYLHWPRWFQATGYGTWNLGFLWTQQEVLDAHIFYCPSARPGWTYDTYTGVPPQKFPVYVSGGVRIPYYFDPVTIGGTDRHRKANTIRQGDRSTILIVDTLEVSRAVSHVSDPGWNVAAFDGSVRYVIDKQTLTDITDYDLSGGAGASYYIMDGIFARLTR